MSSIGPEARAAERESDRRAAVPAALAAVAEAGIIYVPVQEVVKEISAARGGPLVVYPVFVVLHMPVEHGGVGFETHFVGQAGSVQPLIAINLVVANNMAHPVGKNLRAAAGQRIHAGCF